LRDKTDKEEEKTVPQPVSPEQGEREAGDTGAKFRFFYRRKTEFPASYAEGSGGRFGFWVDGSTRIMRHMNRLELA
jgi:hypothetical protein